MITIIIGIISGKFLERSKVSKPKLNPSDPTVHYQAEVIILIVGLVSCYITVSFQNLYIGADVTFNNFNFIIMDADEYALRYMEKHPESFPHANIQLILAKLRGPATAHVDKIRAVLCSGDPHNTGSLPYETFR